jgi:hypothetical protein
VHNVLTDYFRCPEREVELVLPSAGQGRTGYFRFGSRLLCYGRNTAGAVAATPEAGLQGDPAGVCVDGSRCILSFDPAEVIENLRLERYVSKGAISIGNGAHSVSRSLYYGVRPFLPVPVRKHIQRRVFAGRMKSSFPTWPVDCTADQIVEKLLATCIQAEGCEEVPFISFWPDGYSSAAILTHDVETASGVSFCPKLMDLDSGFGIPASFQIIPEGRYPTPTKLLEDMRQRGFEVNIHDLNHDGRLYSNRREFLRRVQRINSYGRDFAAKGFRAGALYRNLDWYDELAFAYDMSVPNIGRFEPQEGGCCTVMPYFIGSIVELPVTVTQDYTLFQILGEYSTELWVRQIQLIREAHGLISIIAHPDYLQEKRAQQTYFELLAHLAELREQASTWIALPREVNDWWRARSQMTLVHKNGTFRIEGPDSNRARIAYARLSGDSIRYSFSEEYAKDQH